MKKISYSKKQLKSHINESGFYVSIKVDPIQRDKIEQDSNAISTGVEVPKGDDILFFRGTASQKFPVGEKNRNGYKIDVSAWDFSNYLKNPQVLLQHDDNKPIGKTMNIKKRQNSIDIEFFVDPKTLNDQDVHRIKSGFFPALSTGHITKEVQFENNETGKRISEDEFMELPFEETRNFTMVVTDAEAVEMSVVSIGSNPDALTIPNALQGYFEKHFADKIKKNNDEDEDDDDPSASHDDEGADKPEDKKDDEVEGADKDKNTDKDTPENKPENGEGADKTDGEKPEGDDDAGKPDDEGKKTDGEKPVDKDQGEDNRVVIPKESYNKLKKMSDDLLKTLNNVKCEGDDPDGEDKKEDPKPEDKTPENKSDDKLDKVDLNKIDPAVKTVLQELVQTVYRQQNDLKELQKKFDDTPKRKGVIYASQFEVHTEKKDAKKKEDKPKSNGAAFTQLLQKIAL